MYRVGRPTSRRVWLPDSSRPRLAHAPRARFLDRTSAGQRVGASYVPTVSAWDGRLRMVRSDRACLARSGQGHQDHAYGGSANTRPRAAAELCLDRVRSIPACSTSIIACLCLPGPAAIAGTCSQPGREWTSTSQSGTPALRISPGSCPRRDAGRGPGSIPPRQKLW
jgi:hypothetical protein